MCDYQGHEFGAHYLDSICCDGYLWDADSGDTTDSLTVGGEIPCPQCNHENWLEYLRDEVEEDGALAFIDGKPRQCPLLAEKLKYPADLNTLTGFWLAGYDAAANGK